MAKRLPRGSPAAEFVKQYLIDGDGGRAALAAGYPNASWGHRLLQRKGVRSAIDEGLEKKRLRLAVNPERIMAELAKIAFSNAREYYQPAGKTVDIHQLNTDQTAAIQEFQIDEQEDQNTGQVYRRTKIKLYDKLAAMRDLARCIGMLREEHVLTLEHKIKAMTPQERVDMANALLDKAREYLPAYRAAVARGEIIEPETSE
jgi:phage terminase small subunit